MNKTPEQFLAEAQQLREQAAKIQEEAKEAAEQADRQARLTYQRDACDLLVTKLATAGISASTATMKWGGYEVKLDSGLVQIRTSLVFSHYTKTVVGVEVTLGTYGERPQSWKADKPVQLPFDKIIKSLERRIEKAKIQKQQSQQRQDILTERIRIRIVNQFLVDALENEFPTVAVIDGSDTTEQRVTINLYQKLELTGDEARQLLRVLESFRKS